MAYPRRRVRAALLLAAAFALVSSLPGCETLVGIHDSRSLSEAEQDSSNTVVTSATPAPRGAAADVPVDNPGTMAAAQPGEERPDLSLMTPSGPADSPGSGSVSDDSPPPVTGSEATDTAAPPAGETSDAGTQPPDPPPDGGQRPVQPTCTPPALGPAQAGTAFLFTAGPNGGNANGRGSCGFPNSALARAPRYYGAVEPALMNTAAACGACLRATFGTRSVELTIIDVIEPNPLAHGRTLSIDSDAKRVLSDSGQNPDVQFTFVPCSAPDTIRLEFAGPGNPSVLVLGHRNPLRAVRLSTATGSVQLLRRDYNYWEPPRGFPGTAGPVSLTLSDEDGHDLLLTNLAVTPTLVDTGLQFPLPGCPDGVP